MIEIKLGDKVIASSCKDTEVIRNLLTWLSKKGYLNNVTTERDEDFNGNWIYEETIQKIDPDKVLDEYLEYQNNQLGDSMKKSVIYDNDR